LAVMRVLDHPNIVKVHESFEDRQNVFLVMELLAGGELFDRIVELDHFSETQAAIVMQQIFRIMLYLHEHHITHRDVKPENFLFQTKEPIESAVLKIIDFGLSCRFEQGKCLTSKSGTVYYVAPEVLAKRYDHMSDMWSCGCLMYVLLCGYPPFFAESEDDDEIIALVCKGNFSFKPSDWDEVSDESKNLIRSLLTLDPEQRCSAEDALGHEWVKNTAPQARPPAFTVSIVDKLRKFNSSNVLRKAALHIIASHIDETRIDKLREAFTSLDSKGNGILTLPEIKKGIDDAGFADVPDLQQILEGMTDGSGVVDYTEFIAATLDRKVVLEESACWTAFRVLDRDGDGRITTEDLRRVIGDGEESELSKACGADSDTMAEVMQEVDKNGDGEIDFDEFMTMMRGRSRTSLTTAGRRSTRTSFFHRLSESEGDS